MKKTFLKIGAILLILIAVAGGYLLIQIQSLDVEQVTDDVYVLYGMGGNVGVLNTDAGTVIVDTMTFKLQGTALLKKAEELTGKAVVMIINTHYHGDHTHGNPAFVPGTRVVATDRTLHHLNTVDSAYFEGAEDLLPNDTFSGFKEIKLGNKTIQLFQTGRGHTDGDLVALFVEDKVMHAGDLFFNRHYPNIDLEGGGSVTEWPATLDPVLALPFDKVIPGHGPLSDSAGLKQFQQFMQQLADIGATAKREGWTMEATIAMNLLTEDANYEPIRMIVPIGLDREFVLTRTWEEATNNFTRRQ